MRAALKIFFILLFFFSAFFSQQNVFKLGNENLLSQKLYLIRNKKIALVINKTSVLQNGVSLLDTLLSLNFSVAKIFALEHGLNLKKAPGEKIENSKLNDIPVISLYGKKKKPDADDLRGVDVVVYDIQDVGVRFFTYISSLKLIMESAAQNDCEIIVLDRPNPQGAKIEGEILDEKFKSFVGIDEIPTVYGMTTGELAMFFASEIEKEIGRKIKLEVVKMSNYRRENVAEYFREWIPPSPNLRSLDAARLYPGLCFLEATDISEGRGTGAPFLQFGAPYFNGDEILRKLNETEFAKSLIFKKTEFVPRGSIGYAPKYVTRKCFGIKIEPKNYDFNSTLFGVKLLKILDELYPGKIKFNYNRLAKLYGNRNLEKYLKGEISFDELKNKMKTDKAEFENIRRRFLLY